MIPKFAPMLLIGAYQRPCDREAQRSSLAGVATPLNARFDIKRTDGVSHDKRLLNMLNQRASRKVITQRAFIHIPLSRTRCEVDARDARLAPANGMPPELEFRMVGRRHYGICLTAIGVGFCAACG